MKIKFLDINLKIHLCARNCILNNSIKRNFEVVDFVALFHLLDKRRKKVRCNGICRKLGPS